MKVALLASLLGCHEARPASPVPPASSAPSSASTGPGAPAATATGIRRTLLDRAPATDQPGWETRLYLIEYPPSAVAPQHVHPAVGIGYVIEQPLRFVVAYTLRTGDEPLRIVDSH